MLLVINFQWFLDGDNNQATKNVSTTSFSISFNVFLGVIGIGFYITGVGQQTLKITTSEFETSSIYQVFGTTGALFIGY